LFAEAAGDFGLPTADVPSGLHNRRADPSKKAKIAGKAALLKFFLLDFYGHDDVSVPAL
jgi:hypothetical protein